MREASAPNLPKQINPLYFQSLKKTFKAQTRPLARSSLNRERRMSRWPASQGSTSPAGAPPPNPVRCGSACRHGQMKANGRAPGCFVRVRIPGRPLFGSSARWSSRRKPAGGGFESRPNAVRKDSLLIEAVPAGAGRKARRASDRLRIRAIGRTAARPARRRTTTRCRMRHRTLRRRASAPPARLRRPAIRTMRVTRRPLKKRTRICGCDMS